MVAILVIVGLLIIAGTSFGIVYCYRRRKRAGITLSSVGLFLAVLFMIFVPGGIKEVKTGEIAVVKVWGNAVDIKTPGLHFANVVSTQFDIYDTKVQQMEIATEVYTKDAQPSTVTLALQYSIDETKVLDIARNFGNMESLEAKIRNIAIEKTKVVLASKTAMVLIETRNELSPSVQASIESGVGMFYINVHFAVVTDMAFSDAFESAVESKMIAEQKKLEAEYQKEQAIIKAEEEAETMRIRAEADLAVAMLEAQKALAQARGQADAQAEIARGQAQALKIQYIETARMLGLPITETDIVDEDGAVVGIEYNIDTTTCTPEQYEMLEEYMRFINYLEAWDGKLPQVIGDGSSLGGIIITP